MRRLTAVLLGSVAALLSCTDRLTEIGPEALVGIRMSADSVDLRIGTTLQLRAYPIDISGAFRADVRAAWSSDNPAVATVNDSGVVTGIAAGAVTIVASVEGFEGRTGMRVAPAPRLGVTRDSVPFQAQAGEGDPAPDTVGVRNLGGFRLTGLVVDTTVYDSGATDWVLAMLDSASAPATLTLTAMTAGVTTAGRYAATVRLAAADADSSPRDIRVVLEMGAGPPTTAAAAEGDAQTGTVSRWQHRPASWSGTSSATPPPGCRSPSP